MAFICVYYLKKKKHFSSSHPDQSVVSALRIWNILKNDAIIDFEITKTEIEFFVPSILFSFINHNHLAFAVFHVFFCNGFVAKNENYFCWFYLQKQRKSDQNKQQWSIKVQKLKSPTIERMVTAVKAIKKIFFSVKLEVKNELIWCGGYGSAEASRQSIKLIDELRFEQMKMRKKQWTPSIIWSTK